MKNKILSLGIILLFLAVAFSGCNDLNLGEVTQFSITSFNVNPAYINKGETANLSWVVMSAQSVSIDSGIGNVSNVGNRIIQPLETTTFTLTAVNGSKTLTATTQIIIARDSVEDGNDSDGDSDNDLNDESGDSDSDDENIVIEKGDCANVNYIGRYASNNTVFDSSYYDVDEKTGGNPLNIFVTTDKKLPSPIGYSNYTSNYIDGLISRLIEKEQGKTYTFQIPPAEAYGAKKLSVGDRFHSSSFAINTINPELSLNQTLEVTKFTDSALSLKWVELDDFGPFTMPQTVLIDLLASTQEDMILIPPPHFIWKNASEIIGYDEETVTIKTIPTKTENLFDTYQQVQFGFGQDDVFSIFPDATTATYDDTTITLTSNPEVGAEYEFSYSYFGQEIMMTYTVINITDDTIGLTIETEGYGETQTQTVQRSLTFSRTFEFPRKYEDIPSSYQDALIGLDLEREGYSINKLAGETLIFEVTIENVFKTSQL